MQLFRPLGALVASVLAATAQPSLAYTLNFGASPSQPLVACVTASGVCSTFSRLLQSYGDIAGVVDVSTHSADGGALTWWNTGYNDLYGVAFNNVASVAAPAWVDLVPQQPGAVVTLTHFDLAGYQGQRRDVDVKVYAIGQSTPLFSYVGLIGSTVSGGTGVHTGFDLNLSAPSGLRIQWADPNVAANTAIDNVVFDVAAPVPEPTALSLWMAGLSCLLWLGRQRSAAALAS